jgi:hypothetical protein
VAAGDIIVIDMLIDGGTASISGMATDFTHAPNSPQAVIGAGAHSHATVWKRATGADAGPYTFTLTGGTYVNGAAVRYTGCVATGDPWDVTAATQTTDVNGTTSPPLAVTTTGDDRLLHHSCTNWTGGAWTPSAGFTEIRDTGDRNTFSAYAVQASAGASGSVVATCAGSDKRTAFLGALLPEGGGGEPDPPAEGGVTLGLGLAVSATGARASRGAAPLGVGLAVSATGRRTSRGVAALGVGLAVSGSGSAIEPNTGSVALGLGLAVSATGSAAEPNIGTVTLGFNLAISVTGAMDVAAPVVQPTGNGWARLLGISQEARQMWREAAREKPVACTRDGEPLQDGHCSYCGKIYR